jgi:hypothetical protein
MNRRQVVQLGASLLVTSAGWAHRPGARPWEQDLATLVEQGLAQTHTPGLSVAMVRAGREVNGTPLASHSGGDPGADSVVCLDLAHQTGVLVFANATGNPAFRAFQKDLVLRLLDRARVA